MADKYEEMARQMRDDGVSEEMIARFVAEEMEEDEFRRGKGVTEIEALREWRKIPEHIRKLLLANAFCHNCGTTEFAPGYTLRMRHSCVLIEGCCAKCGAEVARLWISRPRNPAGDRWPLDEQRSRKQRRPQPLCQPL